MSNIQEAWIDTSFLTTNLTNFTNLAWVEHSLFFGLGLLAGGTPTLPCSFQAKPVFLIWSLEFET
jgi:hypothetical protein